MARRKGRLHSILSSKFTISLFYKPTMKNDDIYYFVVINDIIRLKMRFYDNCVLVIDEITQLSMQYVRSLYTNLFELLTSQQDITILVSAFGYIGDFALVCNEGNTQVPIVECPELFEYSDDVYSRFKDFNKGDVVGYGFYLLSICPETFAAVRDNIKNHVETDSKKSLSSAVVKNTDIIDNKAELDDILVKFVTELNKVSSECGGYEYIMIPSNNRKKISLTHIEGSSDIDLTVIATGTSSVDIQLGDIGPTDMDRLLDCIIQAHHRIKYLNVLFPNINRHTIAFNAIYKQELTHRMSAINEHSFFLATRDKLTFKIN